MTLLTTLSDLTGANEASLRLLFSIIVSYPLAWFYRYFLSDQNRQIKYLYLVLTGFFIGLLNFGVYVYHSVISILFTYISLKILGPSKQNVIVNFVFHCMHLLLGYWYHESESYDITWTMPHCVLILKLIGLCFDLWDGAKDPEKLSSSFKKSALSQQPSLMEITAHVFFPSSYLVGPQFSMKRLMNFVDKNLNEPVNSKAMYEGSKRAIFGYIYLALYLVGDKYLPNTYFLTAEFDNKNIITKHVILGIWGKINIAKYISCWLLAEGACITFGLAYNGQSDTDTQQWDGCRNVNLKILEGVTKMGHYIESFNINTNAWAAQYIYKRAAFLGDRNISRAITLIFLAAWHGFHSGYYMVFFLQFMTILMEKDLEVILTRSEVYRRLSQNDYYKAISYIVLRTYATIYMGFALLCFSLLTFDKWWKVYQTFYFSGLVLIFPYYIIYRPIILYFLKSKKETDPIKTE